MGKLSKFKEILKQKKINTAVLLNFDSDKLFTNIFYFTGYQGIGCLVISKKSFLLVPEMEYERAKKTAKGIRIIKWKKKTKLFDVVKDILRKNRIKPKIIGLEKSVMTLNQYRGIRSSFKRIRTKDITLQLYKARRVKTVEELKLIKKSCNIASRILTDCIKSFKSFKTEADVAEFLTAQTRKAGCHLAFEPIVASGSNGSQPHYIPDNTKLKKGFCIIDFGVRYKGYCSDITRTIYLGKPSKKEIEDYSLVLQVQEECIYASKVGTKAEDLFNTAYKRLGKPFNHGLGHGFGVFIHELPNLKPDNKAKLEPNMVTTIEPGIYFPGRYGIRIEDDVLITKKGPQVLISVPKKLVTKTFK